MKRVSKTTYCFRLSDNARELLQRAANAEMRTLSAMAERAIQTALAQYANHDAPHNGR